MPDEMNKVSRRWQGVLGAASGGGATLDSTWSALAEVSPAAGEGLVEDQIASTGNAPPAGRLAGSRVVRGMIHRMLKP